MRVLDLLTCSVCEDAAVTTDAGYFLVGPAVCESCGAPGEVVVDGEDEFLWRSTDVGDTDPAELAAVADERLV